jgi:hypothetical protein
VGAPLEDGRGSGINDTFFNPEDNGAPNAGAAYVYRTAGTSWRFLNYVKTNNGDPSSDNYRDTTDYNFGSSLALSADGAHLVVSAIGDTCTINAANALTAHEPAAFGGDCSVADSGAVYLY